MKPVLVTGGSGFLGSHVLLQLLAAGRVVRTTVRDGAREPLVRAMLASAGMVPGKRLSFVTADLGTDQGWDEAAAGCDYVLHVASPFPAGKVADENEVIGPARDGTLRVLRAARNAGVQRVVLTSSFAAVGYGHPYRPEPIDESSWANLSGSDITPYIKSKTLAERAAWDFATGEGNGLELTVINPVGIFGPVLGPDYSASIWLIKQLLDGAMEACPQFHFGVVDVRDVAALHLRAMTDPAARGERFIAVAGKTVSLFEVACLLRERLGERAARVPTRELPEPGSRRPPASGEKARRVLGWHPRSNEDALLATAEGLLALVP